MIPMLEFQDMYIGAYLATLETSETTEDVLERREELEDVCPIEAQCTFEDFVNLLLFSDLGRPN